MNILDRIYEEKEQSPAYRLSKARQSIFNIYAFMFHHYPNAYERSMLDSIIFNEKLEYVEKLIEELKKKLCSTSKK